MGLSYYTHVPFEIKLDRYSGGFVVVKDQKTHKQVTIIPFKKGDGTTCFRYSSGIAGRYTYSYKGERGVFTINPYREKNVLYRHGGITVAKNKRYLQHADGTPFFLAGRYLVVWCDPSR